MLFSDGVTWIDSLSFGSQTTDVSRGRNPDGGDAWEFFTDPTPGSSNGGGMVTDLCISFADGVITLSWSAVPDAAGYHIQVADTPYGEFSPLDYTWETTWEQSGSLDHSWYRVTVER